MLQPAFQYTRCSLAGCWPIRLSYPIDLKSQLSHMLRNWNLCHWHLLTKNTDWWWRHYFLSDINNIWKETSSVNVFTKGNFMMLCRICSSLTSCRSLIVFLYLESDESYLRLFTNDISTMDNNKWIRKF